MFAPGTPHLQEDHECWIIVGDQTFKFESVNSAIDALTRDGLIRADDARQNESTVSAELITSWP